MAVTNQLGIDPDKYKWGFHDPEKYVYKSRKGLDREIVELISSFMEEIISTISRSSPARDWTARSWR